MILYQRRMTLRNDIAPADVWPVPPPLWPFSVVWS
jgi:hypothetical protein